MAAQIAPEEDLAVPTPEEALEVQITPEEGLVTTTIEEIQEVEEGLIPEEGADS